LPLANGEQTVRLKCLDVFHWRCLCEQAAKLPPHTAPAGHVCAVCEDKIVPDPHAAGPIADQLRSFLATVKWSGLMLQPPAAVNPAAFSSPHSAFVAQNSNAAPPMYTGSQEPPAQKSPSQAGLATPTNVASGIRMTANARKNLSQPTDVVLEMGADADDNKYAKRPVSERIARAVSNQMASTQGSASEEDERTSSLKKTAVILLLVILAAVFILESLSRVRPTGSRDLLLDPNLNPNIRVAEDQ